MQSLEDYLQESLVRNVGRRISKWFKNKRNAIKTAKTSEIDDTLMAHLFIYIDDNVNEDDDILQLLKFLKIEVPRQFPEYAINELGYDPELINGINWSKIVNDAIGDIM